MWIWLSIAGLGIAGCRAQVDSARGLARFEFEHPQMGTLFRVVLYAKDSADASSAADAAFTRLDELNAALSDFEPESELSRLSRASEAALPTKWIAVSRDLGAVLARAREISAASDGAFDVTCGAATRLWRRAIREHELPDPESIEQARASIDWRALEISPDGDHVRWTHRDVRLDLGGIAKGYAVDRMLALLEGRGIHSAMVVGGGDIVAADPPPGASAWRIELLSPTPALGETNVVIDLCRAAVSTSGDLYRAVTIGGIRYSHIVDPHTALGLTTACGASVIAPDGMTADALATAAVVLGPSSSSRLWERFSDCQFRVVAAFAGSMECAESPGFSRFRAH